jgi:putative membrane protein
MLSVACDDRNDPVSEARDVNQDKEQVDNQDSKVLTDAASYNLLSMELGRMAEERAVTPEVKELARELTREHSDVKDDLWGIAQRKQIELPSDVSNEHRNTLENVSEKSGLDFDKEFVDEVISSHRDKIDDFESLTRDSDDPEIREFAINTLPKLRMQLERAERVESMLNQRDDGDGNLFDGGDNNEGTYGGDNQGNREYDENRSGGQTDRQRDDI